MGDTSGKYMSDSKAINLAMRVASVDFIDRSGGEAKAPWTLSDINTDEKTMTLKSSDGEVFKVKAINWGSVRMKLVALDQDT